MGYFTDFEELEAARKKIAEQDREIRRINSELEKLKKSVSPDRKAGKTTKDLK